MIYKKEDFNNCQFNPLTELAVLDAYPKLSEIVDPEWRDDYLDAILRYMIMVYDPKSALVFSERDLSHRKIIALELAHIDDELLSEALINAVHKYCPTLTVRFLYRFVRSKEWAAICAFEAAFRESIIEVMKPITGKSSREILDAVHKKAAIKDEIEKDIKRLDQLYRVFYGEDDDLQAKSKRRLTPEMIANGK